MRVLTMPWRLFLLVPLFLSFPKPADAIGLGPFGWAYSFSDRVLAKNIAPGANQVSGWGWILDPSTAVLNGQVTFQYDPSLITILPQYSGFIGDFSNDPSTAIPVNSTDTSPLDVTHLPGPRPGMIWSLTVNANTVTLAFDTSANPVNLDNSNTDINFFVLSVATSQAVTGWTQLTSGTGQFRELGSLSDHTQTYAVCSSSTQGGNYFCGDPGASTNANFGFNAIFAPEPSYFAILAVGFAALLGAKGMRRKHKANQNLL